MTSLRLHILNFFLMGLCLSACVEPLEFEVDSDVEYVLIDGVISNSPDERTISVSRGAGFDQREFKPVNARGNIYRDGQLWDILAVQGVGQLYVPFTLKLEEGRSYEIEITTSDGDVFRSQPQIVQPILRMDSLSFGVERRLAGTTFSGLPRFEQFVDVFAHVRTPGPSEERYYRWQVDGTFSFVESSQPQNPNNLPSTCYLSHYVSENPTTVLSSDGLAEGDVKKLVNSRVADESFLFRHVINVYMHAIDKSTFDYYDRAIRLTQSAGTLFDEVPAPVQGNVKKTEGEPEIVLGQIDFSLVDTMRISLSKGILKVPISNICETPTPCPTRPPAPGGVIDPIYCKCWDCDLALPNASLFPPFFWDE